MNCATCHAPLDETFDTCGKSIGCTHCDSAFCSHACLAAHEAKSGLVQEGDYSMLDTQDNGEVA